MMNTKPYSINLLMRQYRDIGQNCDKVHQIELVGNNVHEWNVWFRGPPGTLYEGGLFKVNLKYPDDYPEHPPVMRFMNEMWHPNIFKDGRVCISMLHPNDDKDADPDEKPSERWRPCITAEQIFDAVIAMLSSPNPSSPANMEADIQYKFDNASYEAKVKHLVKKTQEDL